MTNHELNTEIERALGHKIFTADASMGHAWCGGSQVRSAGGNYVVIGKHRDAPHVRDVRYFTDDLNVIREVLVERIAEDQTLSALYHDTLCEICMDEWLTNKGGVSPRPEFASAHQCARALLKTLTT